MGRDIIRNVRGCCNRCGASFRADGYRALRWKRDPVTRHRELICLPCAREMSGLPYS